MRKRVPWRLRRIEPRATASMTLHTDPETIAFAKAPLPWQSIASDARFARNASDDGSGVEAAATRILLSRASPRPTGPRKGLGRLGTPS